MRLQDLPSVGWPQRQASRSGGGWWSGWKSKTWQTDGDLGQRNWGMGLLMDPLPSHALATKSSFFCEVQILLLWMILGPCQTFDGFPLSLPHIGAGWLLKSGQTVPHVKPEDREEDFVVMLNLPALCYQLEVPWPFFGLFLKHFWNLYTSGVKWDLLCPTPLRPRGSTYKLPLTPGLMRSLWAGVRASLHEWDPVTLHSEGPLFGVMLCCHWIFKTHEWGDPNFCFSPDSANSVASVAWHFRSELLLLHFYFYVVYLNCQKCTWKL